LNLTKPTFTVWRIKNLKSIGYENCSI